MYLFNEGTGTTTADSSGNGNTCTFFTGNTPTWITGAANYLSFNGATGSLLTCPAAAFNGAQTIEIWYQPLYGEMAGTNNSAAIISTDAANGTGLQVISASSGWGSAFEWYNSANAKVIGVVDRAIGPTGVAVTFGTNPLMYINGHAPVGYKVLNTGSYASFAATTTAYIGTYKNFVYPAYSFNGNIFAVITRSGIATPTQIAADDAYVRYAKLTPNGLTEVDATASSRPLLARDGDSIVEGGQVTNTFNQTYPYFDEQLIGHSFDTYNMAVGGELLSNMVSTYATKVHPLLMNHPNGIGVVTIGGGTNDVVAGVSAATLEGYLTTYCAAVHADSGKCVFENILPRTTFTAPQAAIAVAVNVWALGQLQAGTVFDSIADRAGVPWELTTIASGASNSTCTPDGIHPTLFCNQLIAQNTAMAIHTAVSPGSPFWVKEVVPYQVLTAAATTQTVALLQLLPTQQVCGIKSTTATAFAGTSITAVTMAVGDSGGTSTQYLTSQSIFAAGKSINQNPNFVSANGIVQGLFTSTGANLSALTAGNVNVDICVVSTP